MLSHAHVNRRDDSLHCIIQVRIVLQLVAMGTPQQVVQLREILIPNCPLFEVY